MNGLLQMELLWGPELSRALVEILLQTVDNEVSLELESLGYRRERSYNISRYIDDIFIFSNSEEEINTIISKYALCAEKYHLKLNERKQEVGSLPRVWFGWKDQVETFVENFIRKIFYALDDEQKYLVKGKNLLKINIYSFSPTYNNTEKVVSVMYLIENEVGEGESYEALSEMTIKYDYLCDSNLEDLVNLLLLFACNSVELNTFTENRIIEIMKKNQNPILWAVFLIYSKYDDDFQEEIALSIE